MTLITVPCAVCGASAYALLYPGAIDPSEDPARYFSSSRLNAAYPDIVRCRVCGLVMANPRDDEATLARVYGQLTDETYDGEDFNRSFAAAEHQRLLLAVHPPPARVLDMGCATGFFTTQAADAGYDVTGADASQWSVERAKKREPRVKFEVGSIESLSFDAEFDVVTLWDVLEHVHSPRAVLERIAGWLKPGGTLLMSMPNSASLVAKLLGPRWVLLLREHLWYFSPETIVKLLGSCGFDFVQNDVKWVRFSLANVAGRLSQYGGALSALQAWSNSAALKRASIRFPMGEMNVVAKKR